MPRLIYSTRPPVPIDALRLNEDITSLGRILRELRWIDGANMHAEPTKGRQMIRFITGQIKMAERHAREKMQTEFLDPRRKKIERRQQKSF